VSNLSRAAGRRKWMSIHFTCPNSIAKLLVPIGQRIML
jgi:hypothetical protein